MKRATPRVAGQSPVIKGDNQPRKDKKLMAKKRGVGRPGFKVVDLRNRRGHNVLCTYRTFNEFDKRKLYLPNRFAKKLFLDNESHTKVKLEGTDAYHRIQLKYRQKGQIAELCRGWADFFQEAGLEVGKTYVLRTLLAKGSLTIAEKSSRHAFANGKEGRTKRNVAGMRSSHEQGSSSSNKQKKPKKKAKTVVGVNYSANKEIKKEAQTEYGSEEGGTHCRHEANASWVDILRNNPRMKSNSKLNDIDPDYAMFLVKGLKM